jgi:hypothetical protein
VPTISNFAIANEELAEDIIHVMPCCRKRKNICRGCVHVKQETWSVHFAILILTDWLRWQNSWGWFWRDYDKLWKACGGKWLWWFLCTG